MISTAAIISVPCNAVASLDIYAEKSSQQTSCLQVRKSRQGGETFGGMLRTALVFLSHGT